MVTGSPEQPSERGASAASVPVGVRTRAVMPGHWALLALASFVAAAVVVFALLPGWLARPPAPPPAKVAVPAAPAPDAAETVRARLASAEAKARYEMQLKAVNDLGAGAWAAADLAAAAALAEAAAKAAAGRDQAEAARQYDAATQKLAEIAARAEDVFKESLARAEAALEAGEQVAAIAQFRRALAIRPDATAARNGLARAEQLGKVLAQMNTGAAHARAGDWEAARSSYAEAAKLDPAYAPAREALAQAEGQLRSQRFAALISRGLAHLERSEWAPAEQAFRAAAQLRPGDRAAADGLARANEGLERERIGALRREAERLEAAERWSEALAAYRRALALDPSLDFAKRGAERSQQMAALQARLAALLSDPGRLSAAAVRAEARAVLDEAGSASGGGPQLAQARERLAAALDRATTPVAVRLASDGATEVTVYRVGMLGRFAAREIRLVPGTYTVVGVRPGYKDVRIELKVAPDSTPSLFVACREPV